VTTSLLLTAVHISITFQSLFV